MQKKSDHPLYRTWNGMKARCLNPNAKSYESYGGRGITICARWMDFAAFAADVGARPDGSSLDRIDNNGPYSPENCRWATVKEQHRNRRNNQSVVIDGVSHRLVDLADRYGKNAQTIAKRAAKNLTLEEVLSDKQQPRGDHKKAYETRLAQLAARTHCKHGHERNEANTRHDKRGFEYCRVCSNIKHVKAARRKRLAAKLNNHSAT